MAAWEASPEVQLRQTAFRMAAVERWGIKPGAKVLEVGCGQGDMTAVLADAVGKEGFVTAVDSAKPSEGAPVSLGDSTRRLHESDLGSRIEFRLDFDVLDPENAFAPDKFDMVVFAHSSWYFSSPEALQQTFETVRPWAKALCLSEWDLDPDSLDQVAHWLAILIHGQVEAEQPEPDANVRTPLSKIEAMELVKGAGWKIERDFVLDSSGLDDGRWEIEACLRRADQAFKSRKLSPRVRKALEQQVEALRQLQDEHGAHSLPSYGLVTRRLEPGEGKFKKSRFSGREDRTAAKKAKA